MLRVLIVDDEAPARRYMRRLLEAAPDVLIEGEAATIDQARKLIHAHRPDVIFLDIILTQGTGFELLEGLDRTPSVVFVTAHSNYAAQAFDINAVDYLLKPVNPDRLAQTLNRLRPRATDYLTTRTRTGTRQIKVRELTVIQAEGDYVRLHSAAYANELIHITLKRLAAQLPSPPFCPVSRSLIINLDHIAHLAHRSGTQTEVNFINSVTPVMLGRTATLRLRRAMA
ncbi:LytR/AlgR family response regulator transcription factor [Pollutimonas harenae]|uniref:Response regulator n=1 Tax=Pollutimonas harenae TaxID=657015 RepID=A0A853GSQ0_9BURK|nr:response regulator transcription factor [Pollutimonas harenae]NYT85187.1 response regulator [Pollutimonas harenae]TEA72436.1 response regulator [Pollutimonas harenae]